MDTGSIAKPAPISAYSAPHRVDTLAASGAVRTELPPEASVQQVSEAEAVRFEPSDGARDRAALDAALRDLIDRRIMIEPKTREVVYQTIDRESGEVIRQLPDQAMLRLRAYSREMREKAEQSHADGVGRVA
jgi:FlaG protein